MTGAEAENPQEIDSFVLRTTAAARYLTLFGIVATLVGLLGSFISSYYIRKDDYKKIESLYTENGVLSQRLGGVTQRLHVVIDQYSRSVFSMAQNLTDENQISDRIAVVDSTQQSLWLNTGLITNFVGNDIVVTPGNKPQFAKDGYHLCDRSAVGRIAICHAASSASSCSYKDSAVRLDALATASDPGNVYICMLASAPKARAELLDGPNVNFGCNDSATSSVVYSAPAGFHITQAEARVVASDGIGRSEAKVVSQSSTSALAVASFTGRDREWTGNCPGGGHGAVQIMVQIAPNF